MGEIRAVIAEDEEALRAELRARLAQLWPELRICGEAADGLRALRLIEAECPEVAFLDIRMPELTGLEVARRVARLCRVVFITAYDRYAVEAFEAEAVDYLLKPVSDERLRRTVERLRTEIGLRRSPTPDLARIVEKVAETLQGRATGGHLRWIRVSHRDSVRLIPVEEVCYFQARDKYTAVVTLDREWLIRTPIQELADELDPEEFWRIHRGTVVNAGCIAEVSRSTTRRRALRLKNRPETLLVSRSYAHRFKQM